MVIADADEREVCAGVLNVRIMNRRAIDRPIAVDRRRHMEVVDLTSVGYATDVEHRTIVAMRNFIGVFHDLVDEISEMQDEPLALIGRSALILPNHPPIGILCALIHALARNESKSHRLRILNFRSRNGSADSAAIALRINEAIPVNSVRLQVPNEDARRPVRCTRYRRASVSDNTVEACIFCHLDAKDRFGSSISVRAARPKDDARGIRIARGNALGKKIPPLLPSLVRYERSRARPNGGSAKRGCRYQEGTAIKFRHKRS